MILLVRHGETTWNVEGRVQGWAGSTLSGRGRRQARETGARLAEAGVDRLVVSDLQRTEETARLLEEGGLDAETAFESAWRERGLGEYQGLDRSSVADRHPGFDPQSPLTTVEGVPGGESRDEFVERVRDGWESVRGVGDETVAVVTHAGPVRVVVAAVTGRDLPALANEWAPDNCSVTELDASGTRVVRRGDTAHLSDRDGTA